MRIFNVCCAVLAVVLGLSVITVTTPSFGADKVQATKAVKKKVKSGKTIGKLKAAKPRTYSISCGTTVCTCGNDDECDILFTSTKCKAGTAVHNTRTSGGQCQAAD